MTRSTRSDSSLSVFPGATAMLERPGRDHHGIDFPSLQPKGDQPFDHGWSKPLFHEAKHLAFRGGRREAQPVADLCVGGIRKLLLATVCHRKAGKMLYRRR